MGKAGKRLLEGVAEAVAIAKGEQPAPRIHMQGHAYVPEVGFPVAVAIDVVLKHLRSEWIVDACRDEPVMGCASCRAVEIEQSLEMLKREIEDKAAAHFAPKLQPNQEP